jgi:ribose/xylose/arabinose/galactoside ABC-type transport system permease subunit
MTDLALVALAGQVLADDVSSWSTGHWVGVIVSVILGFVIVVGLTLVLATQGVDDCLGVVACIVALCFGAYIVWSWWLGPFVGHL